MITSIILILPEDNTLSPEQYKRKLKYATSSRDGTVKIWSTHNLRWEMTI
jgi:hypothetical protein